MEVAGSSGTNAVGLDPLNVGDCTILSAEPKMDCNGKIWREDAQELSSLPSPSNIDSFLIETTKEKNQHSSYSRSNHTSITMATTRSDNDNDNDADVSPICRLKSEEPLAKEILGATSSTSESNPPVVLNWDTKYDIDDQNYYISDDDYEGGEDEDERKAPKAELHTGSVDEDEKVLVTPREDVETPEKSVEAREDDESQQGAENDGIRDIDSAHNVPNEMDHTKDNEKLHNEAEPEIGDYAYDKDDYDDYDDDDSDDDDSAAMWFVNIFHRSEKRGVVEGGSQRSMKMVGSLPLSPIATSDNEENDSQKDVVPNESEAAADNSISKPIPLLKQEVIASQLDPLIFELDYLSSQEEEIVFHIEVGDDTEGDADTEVEEKDSINIIQSKLKNKPLDTENPPKKQTQAKHRDDSITRIQDDIASSLFLKVADTITSLPDLMCLTSHDIQHLLEHEIQQPESCKSKASARGECPMPHAYPSSSIDQVPNIEVELHSSDSKSEEEEKIIVVDAVARALRKSKKEPNPLEIDLLFGGETNTSPPEICSDAMNVLTSLNILECCRDIQGIFPDEIPCTVTNISEFLSQVPEKEQSNKSPRAIVAKAFDKFYEDSDDESSIGCSDEIIVNPPEYSEPDEKEKLAKTIGVTTSKEEYSVPKDEEEVCNFIELAEGGLLDLDQIKAASVDKNRSEEEHNSDSTDGSCEMSDETKNNDINANDDNEKLSSSETDFSSTHITDMKGLDNQDSQLISNNPFAEKFDLAWTEEPDIVAQESQTPELMTVDEILSEEDDDISDFFQAGSKLAFEKLDLLEDSDSRFVDGFRSIEFTEGNPTVEPKDASDNGSDKSGFNEIPTKFSFEIVDSLSSSEEWRIPSPPRMFSPKQTGSRPFQDSPKNSASILPKKLPSFLGALPTLQNLPRIPPSNEPSATRKKDTLVLPSLQNLPPISPSNVASPTLKNETFLMTLSDDSDIPSPTQKMVDAVNSDRLSVTLVPREEGKQEKKPLQTKIQETKTKSLHLDIECLVKDDVQSNRTVFSLPSPSPTSRKFEDLTDDENNKAENGNEENVKTGPPSALVMKRKQQQQRSVHWDEEQLANKVEKGIMVLPKPRYRPMKALDELMTQIMTVQNGYGGDMEHLSGNLKTTTQGYIC